MQIVRIAPLLLVGGCSFVAVHGRAAEDSRGAVECTSSYIAPVVDGLAAIITDSLGAIGVYELAQTPRHPLSPRGLTAPFAPVGFLYSIAALYGADNVHTCREAREAADLKRARAREDERAREARAIEERAAAARAAREHAFELMKQAATAARSGDCEAVVALDARVRDADAEFHDVVFARDAAIARCLEPARPSKTDGAK